MIITIIFIMVGFGVTAQSVVGDTMRFVQSIWTMKRKEAVVNYLQLTEAEKVSFWPVYDSYSEAIRFLEMEYLQILSYYSKQDSPLSGVETERISFKILQNDVLLARQYFRKFKRAVSPMRASEFMQIDHSLRTMLRLEMQRNSPPMTFSETVIYSRSQ